MLSSSPARSVDIIVLVGGCSDCAMGLKTRTSKNACCRSHPQKLSAATSRRAPSSLFAVLCFSCSWDSDCRAGSVSTL